VGTEAAGAQLFVALLLPLLPPVVAAAVPATAAASYVRSSHRYSS